MSVQDDDELSSELSQQLVERGQPQTAAAVVVGELAQSATPVPPPATVLTQLMQKVHASERLTWFAPLLAKLFDLTLDGANDLIRQIRGEEGWMDGPGPGVKLLPIQSGPKAGEALAAVVKLLPNAEFPLHPHVGLEQVLLLEGGYRDSSGVEYWRGELHVSQPGSQHSFVAVGGIPCICVSLAAISPAAS